MHSNRTTNSLFVFRIPDPPPTISDSSSKTDSDSPRLDYQRHQHRDNNKMAAPVPAWIRFCSDTAPLAAIVVFMAVCNGMECDEASVMEGKYSIVRTALKCNMHWECDLFTFPLFSSPISTISKKRCSICPPQKTDDILFRTQPYPTIQKVQKAKSVGSLPLLPYSSMIANCVLWVAYGLLTNTSKVWFTNSVGLVFGLFYFLKFIKYTPQKSTTLPGTVRQHLQGCSAIIVGILLWLLICYSTVRRKNMWMPYAAGVIGNTAVVFCLLMFASPLAALKTVLRTRSASSIPLPFTLATILNCFLWSVAGLGEFKDFNIYFPNLLGLAFGLIQVGLKILFDYGSRNTIKSEDPIDLVA